MYAYATSTIPKKVFGVLEHIKKNRLNFWVKSEIFTELYIHICKYCNFKTLFLSDLYTHMLLFYSKNVPKQCTENIT